MSSETLSRSALIFLPRQLVTGSLPYSQYRSEPAVAVAIWNGERPERPPAGVVSDKLWTVIRQCWADDPMKRPPTNDLITLLNGLRNDIGVSLRCCVCSTSLNFTCSRIFHLMLLEKGAFDEAIRLESLQVRGRHSSGFLFKFPVNFLAFICQ